MRNLEHPIDFKPVIDKLIQTGAGNDRLNIPYAVQKIIWRLLSSSDRTSSRSSMGVSFVIFFTSSISDSFKESAAVLCCPWEPNLRISMSLAIKAKSSRCGPTVVCFSRISLSWPARSLLPRNPPRKYPVHRRSPAFPFRRKGCHGCCR